MTAVACSRPLAPTWIGAAAAGGRAVLTLLLLCCSTAGMAAELILNDIRLAWGYLPKDFEYTLRDTDILSSGDATITGNDEFATAWNLEWRGLRHLAGPGRSGAPVVGVGALGSWYGYQNGDELQILSAELFGGYAHAVSERLTLHALAVTGLGYGRFTIATPGAGGDLHLDGLTWDIGVEVGASWRIARRWRILGAIDWRQRQGDMSGDGFELDLNSDGIGFTIGLGFMLSSTPRRIE